MSEQEEEEEADEGENESTISSVSNGDSRYMKRRRQQEREAITDRLYDKIRQLTEEITNDTGDAAKAEFQPTPNYENVDINRIPTSAKQKHLFIFAKFVAGHCGIGDMNTMFDKSEVSKFVHEVDTMMIHQVFLAAISSTEIELDMACQKLNRSISFEEDIMPDLEHPLYQLFAKFTAFFMRRALANRPGMVVPMRQQSDLMLEQLSFRTQLELAMKRKKRAWA
jgi:hypothetical protein